MLSKTETIQKPFAHSGVSSSQTAKRMTIFSERQRTEHRGKDLDEGNFEYLDASARPEAMEVRRVLEDAFSRYPQQHRRELETRLRGPELQFSSATFELMLHDLMVKQGWKVEIHPTLPASDRKPDFKVTTSDGEAFYLEATLARQYSDDIAKQERFQNSALRGINDLHSPDFLLHLTISGRPTAPVDPRNLHSKVDEWLKTLRVEDYDARQTKWGEFPTFRYDRDCIRIHFRAIPRSPDRRGPGRKAIGSYSFGPRGINAIPSIRNAAKKKTLRYGELDLPLVVAINVEAEFYADFQEVDALFGDVQFILDRNDPAPEPQQIRVPNGVWTHPDGPRFKRLSAAWIFKNFGMWYLISRKENWLYVNPNCLLPVPNETLRFPHAIVNEDEGILERTDGISMADVLGLAQDWPTIDAA